MYRVEVLVTRPGQLSEVLTTLSIPTGLPLPRVEETVVIDGVEYTVFAVAWEFNTAKDDPQPTDVWIQLSVR